MDRALPRCRLKKRLIRHYATLARCRLADYWPLRHYIRLRYVTLSYVCVAAIKSDTLDEERHMRFTLLLRLR